MLMGRAYWRIRLVGALIAAILVFAGSTVFYVIVQNHRAAEQTLLDKNLHAQSVAWRAAQTMYQHMADTYFREYILQDTATLGWLREALDPLQRDQARSRLQQHLQPVYARLQQEGVRQLHFHLPDGESFLRMHRPEQFGDSLLDDRPAIRIANQRLEPVSGFELGRVVSGYRHVFPIVVGPGEHLGSVEIAVPLANLLPDLQVLLPEREFQKLLWRAQVEQIIFPEFLYIYHDWPGSPALVLEDPEGVFGDPAVPLSPTVQRLLTEQAPRPAWQHFLTGATEATRRIVVDGQDYAVIRNPILDFQSDVVGMLISYRPEADFALLDRSFWLALTIAALLFLTIAFGLYYAFVMTTRMILERNRLRIIMNTLGEGLYVMDDKGAMTDVNPCACDVLGFSREQMLGHIPHNLFHSHAANQYQSLANCPIFSTVSSGEYFYGEEQFRRVDGRLIDVRVASRPIRHQDSFRGAVTVFQDITQDKAIARERERVQLSLQQRTEELARSNAELEQFAYAISHDLRQPLRMVSSYLQLLERRLDALLEDETRKMMGFARDAAIRMDQMLLSLLDYSRVGRMGEPIQAIDARPQLDEALRYLGPTIHQSKADIVVEGEWDTIQVSPNEFVRLLQNLIGNAIKYHEAGVRPRVVVGAEPQGDYCLFYVQDHGIGIDPQQTHRLFEVFQRLHTQEQFPGTGVGLAIARKIVERHGGRIWVESAGAGQGSRFFFTLPCPGA